MTRTVIVDTGPLVAFFDRDEKHHQWIREQTKQLKPGLVTCEAVLAETTYLLQRARVNPAALLSLVQRGTYPAVPASGGSAIGESTPAPLPKCTDVAC